MHGRTGHRRRKAYNRLQPELDRIAAINDVAGLQAQIARFHAYRVPAVFGFGAGQDFKNSQAVIAQAVQGGWACPIATTTPKTTTKSRQTRDEYAKHVTRMFELLGDSSDRAAAEAKTVLTIETKLAENSVTRVQRRDPEANYHPMNRTELSALTPHLDWRNYFDGRGSTDDRQDQCWTARFFQSRRQNADFNLARRLEVLPALAPAQRERRHAFSKVRTGRFNFSGKYLQGTKEMQPRWRRCIVSTDRALGEALGQLYIQKTFTPAARARAQEMVKNLVEALRSDLTILELDE